MASRVRRHMAFIVKGHMAFTVREQVDTWLPQSGVRWARGFHSQGAVGHIPTKDSSNCTNANQTHWQRSKLP